MLEQGATVVLISLLSLPYLLLITLDQVSSASQKLKGLDNKRDNELRLKSLSKVYNCPSTVTVSCLCNFLFCLIVMEQKLPGKGL